MTARNLYLTGRPDADALLARDPNALLLGMVLDQQIPMEKAFSGPAVLAERMGGLDVRAIADAEPQTFRDICARPPAVHRFPTSMSARLQSVCRVLVDSYDGDAANLWAHTESGAELFRRIAELPGFGRQKASILVALLGKQYGVTPSGWREAAGTYGEPDSRLSIADVVDDESRSAVRDSKRAMKAAAGRGRQAPPDPAPAPARGPQSTAAAGAEG